MRGILWTVGVGVALVSAAFCALYAGDLISGTRQFATPAVDAGLVGFFLGTGIAGGYLSWSMMRPPRPPLPSLTGQPPASERQAPRKDTEADREQRILKFAEAEHGRVTVPEVAVHCRMTVAQATADLDRMVVQKVAELLVTEDGVLVYVFAGFLSDDEKADAHDF